MATKNITIRVSEGTAEFLENNFGTATAGATISVDSVRRMMQVGNKNPEQLVDDVAVMQQIRAYSLRELKGKFTANEWSYFADSMNGTMITPEFRCNQGALIASVEDSNDFDGLAGKWDVDIVAFIEKVKTLTGAQVDAVFTRVDQFWNSENRDLITWSEEI